MKKYLFNGVSILIAVLVFVLSIKYFYFDTKMGFDTQILELNYSALPMCVDVAIYNIIMPLIVYAGFIDLLDRIDEEISYICYRKC